MKSLLNTNQKNDYLHLSRFSLAILGTALLVCNIANATTNRITAKVNMIVVTENEQGEFTTTVGNPWEKRSAAPVEDKTILNPATVMVIAEKSIEEVIAENNQIIDSNVTDDGVRYFSEKSIETIIKENNQIIDSGDTTEVRPLYLERTIEDKIAEDNAIIENDVVNVFAPLDFETINKRTFTLKQNTNKFVGMN